MQKRKLLHLFIGLSILLQAAFFQVALPNLVLCIGDDGHIAFEQRFLAASDKLNDCQTREFFSNNDENHSDPFDFDCTDINLPFHPSQAEPVQKKNISKLPFTFANTFDLRLKEKIKLLFSLNILPFSSLPPSIGIEQSTVLLI